MAVKMDESDDGWWVMDGGWRPVTTCYNIRHKATNPPRGVQQSQVHSRHALDCLHELTGGLLPPGKYPVSPCNGLTWIWSFTRRDAVVGSPAAAAAAAHASQQRE